MAGNTLVVKHSSNVPRCTLTCEKLMHDGDVPAGLNTNLFIYMDKRTG
jgi:succinate-semialdehyde dehydrogenase/glutarate-semialdehyde dehydrogenase